MIFEEDLAQQAWVEYTSTRDKAALHRLHELTVSLIEVIALSVCPDQFDDLVQEGHLKLQTVVESELYNGTRGTLYTFLSSALRNHMLDVLRRDSRQACDDLGDDEIESCLAMPVISYSCIDVDAAMGYGIRRFPSLHNSISADATRYIISSKLEAVSGGSRGVIRTLCCMYDLDRVISRTLYFSMTILVRMMSLGLDWSVYQDQALAIVNDEYSMEISLVPEVVLMLGRQQADVMSAVFSGSYVKF